MTPHPKIVFLAWLGLGLSGCTCQGEPSGSPVEPPPPSEPSQAEQVPVETADETTHASEAETEPPPSTATVEIDDTLPVAQLVAENHRRMEQLRDAPVHAIRSSDSTEAGLQLCRTVVPRRPPETPVLLKPNLNGFDRLVEDAEDEGWQLRTVSVAFLRGVVRCLTERGHRDITILDAWKPSRLRRGFFRRIGLDRLIDEEGVRIAHLWEEQSDGRSPVVRAHFEGARALPADLLVPRVLAEHLVRGLYISIPRLKMHRYTVTSLSIKNAMGVVILDGSEHGHTRADLMHGELSPWWRRFRRQHVDDRAEYVRTLELFSERMVDVLEMQLPDAVLIEGIPIVGGDGFALVEPYPGEGYAIGSVNPVWADAVGTEIVGYLDSDELEHEIQHRTTPLLEAAAERFYGTRAVLRQIRVIGDDGFRRQARTVHFRGIPGFEIGQPPPP